VNSTPTFFVNGKKTFEGVPTAQQLDAAIEAAS
jgi:protein-disulfide isomerase